jgi:hypothetical protein
LFQILSNSSFASLPVADVTEQVFSDSLSRFPYYANAFVSQAHEFEIMTGIKSINRHVGILIIKRNKDEYSSICIYKPVHEPLFVIVAPITALISKSYSSRYSSSSSIGTTTLRWVSACSTIVEHSQQEGFTECRYQRHVKPQLGGEPGI